MRVLRSDQQLTDDRDSLACVDGRGHPGKTVQERPNTEQSNMVWAFIAFNGVKILISTCLLDIVH